jgi:hypothetical protein
MYSVQTKGRGSSGGGVGRVDNNSSNQAPSGPISRLFWPHFALLIDWLGGGSPSIDQANTRHCTAEP